MTWHYSINGQIQGPLEEPQLQQLISNGALPASALVWREGMPEWVVAGTQFSSLPRAASSAIPSSSVRPVAGLQAPVYLNCQECGVLVSAADSVTIQGVVVCLRCKPQALQKLQEGAPLGALSGEGPWFQGKDVVATNDMVLTQRCFKCNEPASKHLKRKVYWHNPFLYLLIATGVLIYVIVAMIVRRQATVHIGLCSRHNQRRILNRVIAAGFCLGGAGVFVAAGTLMRPAASGAVLWMALIGGILLILAGLIYAIATQLVVPKRISREGYVWLRGAGTAFRNSLPKMER